MLKQLKLPLLLFILLLLAYWQVIFFRHPLKWDAIDLFYPWRQYISSCLRELQLPLWNPYQNCGYPIHADTQSGVWYPFVWIISIFKNYDIKILSLEYFLHIVIGGIGFSFLLKQFGCSHFSRLFFSLSYSMSGFFTGNAQHLSFIIAAAWIPFIFAYFLKLCRTFKLKHSLLTSLFLFLLLSGSYPPFFIITAYILFFGFLFTFFNIAFHKKAQFKSLFISHTVLIISFLLLSLPIIFSIIESWEYTVRVTKGLTENQINFCPFSPQSLISLIFPFAVIRDSSFFDTDISMSNAYIGLLPLLLVFCRIKPLNNLKIVLWLGVFISLLAGFGSYTPFRTWLADYVPLMNLFRFPSVFRLFFIISILAIGALNLDKVIQEESWKNFKGGLFILFFFVLGGSCFAISQIYVSKFLSNFQNLSFPIFSSGLDIYESISFQGPFQCLILFSSILIFLFTKKFSRKIWMLLSLSTIDLFLSVQLNDPTTITSHEVSMAAVIKTTDKFSEDFPIPQLNPVKENDEKMNGISPFWRNMNLLYRTPGTTAYNSFQLTSFSEFSNSSISNQIFNNPVIYLANNSDNNSNIKLLKFSANQISVKLFNPKKDTLVLLQNNYPGWKAFIDNKPAKITSSNIAFMSLTIPKGTHNIQFLYQPKIIIICFFISAFSFLAFLLYFLFFSRFKD